MPMKFANANGIALAGSEIHITDVNLGDTLPRLRFFKDRLRSRVQNDTNGVGVTRGCVIPSVARHECISFCSNDIYVKNQTL